MTKSTRTPRHAAARIPRRLPWRPARMAEACVRIEAAPGPRPGATFGAELLAGAVGEWRPRLFDELGTGYLSQRADVGAARVVSFQPSATRRALAVGDPIRVKDGVRPGGGARGTIIQFNCAADWSIGAQLADGQIVFFAPDEVEADPAADTLVMGPLATAPAGAVVAA